MKAGVIGLGNLGSAVARQIAANGYDVLGWEYDAAVVDEVNRQHTNTRYLEGLPLGDRVKATTDIVECLNSVDIAFVTLPSRFIQRVLSPCVGKLPAGLPLVNMSKGLHEDSGETVFSQLSALFPQHPLAMLAGPSLANEFSRGVFTAVVAATDHPGLAEQIRTLMAGPRFAVVCRDDAIGVELGGILKNIYALGMGLFDGRPDRGMNLVGAYLTQAIAEMQQLGTALGGKPESFFALSGIGDLITTALSEHSHNQTMGRLVAAGKTTEQIREQMGVLPEGYNTVQVALGLAEKHGLQLPLAGLIHEAVSGRLDVDSLLDQLAGLLD